MTPQERAAASGSLRAPNGVRDDVRVADETETTRLTAWVHGSVQGVGFRWWTRSRALELGLTGTATNLADGRVEVVAEGPRPSCERLLDALRTSASPGRVDHVAERWSAPKGDLGDFRER